MHLLSGGRGVKSAAIMRRSAVNEVPGVFTAAGLACKQLVRIIRIGQASEKLCWSVGCHALLRPCALLLPYEKDLVQT